MSEEFVRPWRGDPMQGHLETPVSAGLGMALINNLPAYRPGLEPSRRGLEVGMAHGYFLVGPFYKLGPLRDSEYALAAGVMAALGLVLILTVCLSLYGSVSFEKPSPQGTTDQLQTAEGWSSFTGGFLIGGAGGVLFAGVLLFFLPVLQGIGNNLFN
ncbi:MAG: photosystem I reaction center subunit XI [Gloeomargarita sp. SKYG116]|nr:photosystem I reaction center subunit XI [Gloeomargarita sp. SKYG116]MCS7226833.1 photosystem I reaction center subunit XI [Gloeomargarita sp. SKYB31]MDW8400457.1 photosystem I reaction center subunit XI [Gloeomargarita sp. SKYGB_i_bin116]